MCPINACKVLAKYKLDTIVTCRTIAIHACIILYYVRYDAMHQYRDKFTLLPLVLGYVSREGLAPIVKAYSRLILVDGLVL